MKSKLGFRIASVFVIPLIGLPLIGGLAGCSANSGQSTSSRDSISSKKLADSGKAFSSESFENGKATGWSDGNCTIAVVTEVAHSGQHCLKVSDPSSPYAGPSYNILSLVQYGHTYRITACLRTASGSAKGTVTVNRVDSNGVWYGASIANQVPISSSDWTTVSGDFTLTENLTLSSLQLSFRTLDTSVPYYIDDVSIKETESLAPERQTDILSLKSKYDFTLGTAAVFSDLIDDHSKLIAKHFSSLTPGNEMKSSSLYDSSHQLDFTTADQFADFAIKNNMKLRGHNLVWHSQVPSWWFTSKDDPSRPATKQELLTTLKNHITNVLTHFKKKYGSKSPFYCWDVVNEPLSDSHQNNGLRGESERSQWLPITGPEYIADAFKYARAADPDLKLFINDYGIENNNQKTVDMYNLVKSLIKQKVPIDGIGLQMHVGLTYPSISDIQASIEKLGSLGLELQVTELDVNTGGQTDAAALAQEARRYKQLFDLFEKERKYIDVVTIWGTADDGSWLGANNIPLLFDNSLQAKPAYWALVDPSKTTVDTRAATVHHGAPKLGTSSDSLWSDISAITTDTYAKGVTGATAQVKSTWDKNYLYVLADVSDDTTGTSDSIDLYLKNNGPQHFHINRSGKGMDTIPHFITQNSTGYTVQAAIPISGLSPAAGSQIGFDFKVNDDTGNGTVQSICTWNDYQNLQDTSTKNYGILTLN
jgi:endo-1,4-beta-xylanase